MTDISRSKQATDALRFTQFTLDRFADAAFWVGPDARFVYVNDAACYSVGYSRDELLTMTVHDIDPQFTKEVWPDHWKEVKERHSFSLESVHKHRDGSTFPVEITVNFVEFEGQEFNCAFAHDITARKQAEKNLQESEEKYRAIFESFHDVYYRTNREGEITLISPSVRDQAGYDPEDVLGHPVTDFYADPDDQEVFMQEIEKFGMINDYESKFMAKDGRIIDVSISARLIFGDDGHVLGFEGVLRNITGRKRTEEDKAKLEAQLQHSQKMEAVGRLAGGIAHDFNNILTVISGNTDMGMMVLRESDPLYERLSTIKQATDHASELIQQLLLFSRKHIATPEILDLNSVISGLELMLPRLIGEDIVLDFRLADDAGKVKINRGQMEQVLVNLAINARDAMSQGGRLTFETSTLEMDELSARLHLLEKPGTYAVVSVSDTGPGMSKELIENIFEPFFTTKSTGTGLGLSTAYGIIDKNQGRISVYSEEGLGTTFRVYLPACDEDVTNENESGLSNDLPWGNESILLAEDEEGVRDLEVEILTSLGYQVHQFANPDDAVDYYKKNPGGIDLLITDVIMPDLSGPQLAEKCHEIGGIEKVLYISGYTSDALAEHGIDQEHVNLLMKPFSPEELALMVREILDSSDDSTESD